MASRYYVTTPIYYVNDVPHVGTAYTTIAADALRRYHLLRGNDAFMLTGTDEHGLKVERAAKDAGLTPKEFADRISGRFRDAWPKLLVESSFIRTTDPQHEQLVIDLWKRVAARKHLYLGQYEDWYCVHCESFKTDKELLPGNLCPIHQKPVERLKEETYFFDLSAWQKPLLELYERRKDFILPESRRNEVVRFVEGGLHDLSVSRTSFTWGVPVPGDPKHVMYVWFDALANYWTAVQQADRSGYWPSKGNDPATGARVVHLMGKDILRFHAVYWPAFLLAAGFDETELPTTVFAHGFLTVDGHKMSKSLGNVVDPMLVASELGPDALRYQLLRAVAFGQDGDFDHAAMIERYNADLGKNLGNLLSRTLGLCAKMTDGKTPETGPLSKLEEDLWRDIEAIVVRGVTVAWDKLEPHNALAETWAISSRANQYVDQAAPWTEAKKGDAARVRTILGTLLEVLRWLSVLVWPAIPSKSDAMRAQLGLGKIATSIGADLFKLEYAPRPAGQSLASAGPLFPTFDEATANALLARLKPAAPSPSMLPPPPAAPTVTAEQLSAIDLRVGVVKACEKVPKKDKLLRLLVDIGEAEPRTIVAGLALSFAPGDLVGRRVIVVANLAPRDFGKGLVSHGMLLATGPSDALKLATVDGDAPPGLRLR